MTDPFRGFTPPVAYDPSSGNPAEIAAGIQSLIESADRFQLKWRIVPATVITPSNGLTKIRIDGDSSAANAVSLIGVTYANARVMVISVPPTNNFIIGTLPVIDALSKTVYARNNGAGTTASTTFVLPTSSTVGVAFVAPPSGRVKIWWSSEHTHSAANGWTIQSPQIRVGEFIGSGTINQAPSDDIVTRCRSATAATGDKTISNFYFKTGLVPGSWYNVQLYARVNTAGTGTFEYQTLMIEPEK